MASDQQGTTELTRAEKAYARWWVGKRKLIAWPLLGSGLVLLGFGLFANALVAHHCRELHTAVQLSGTTDRLRWVLDTCYAAAPPLGPVTPKRLFLADLPLIAGLVIVGTLVLAAGWWRFEAGVMRKAWWVIYLPAAAAAADLFEDGLLAWLLSNGDDGNERLRFRHSGFATWLLSTVAYTKWALVLAMLVAVALALAVIASRWNEQFPPPRHRPQSPTNHGPATPAARTVQTADPASHGDVRRAVDQTEPGGADDPELAEVETTAAQGPHQPLEREHGDVPRAPAEREEGVVGVCVSGGGIRAAAFALGVLRQLDGQPAPAGNAEEPDGARPLATARYLSAVSGGAWAATAWTLRKAQVSDGNAADAVITALQHDVRSGYQRQKYLMNGRGGVLGPFWWIMLCAFVNLSFIGSLIYLIAWPLGWFESQCAISGTDLGPSLWCGPTATPMPDHHVLFAPSVAFALAGVIVLMVCGAGYKKVVGGWRIGVTLLVLAALFGLYLVVVPRFFHFLASNTFTISTITSVIGTSAFITVAGGVWKLVGGPLVHEVTTWLGRLLPKLLGAVLVLCAILLALVVMYFAGQEILPAWTLLIPVAWLAVLTAVFSPNWPTLHDIFSRRLRRSFDPHGGQPFITTTGDESIDASPQKDQPGWTWTKLAEHTRSAKDFNKPVPELVLCCAQQRNGIAPGGLRAETFTISPWWVRQGRRSTPTTQYVAASQRIKRPIGSEFELNRVTSWLATTGAAFSSAMGRSSLGSTNALLAAINADLGIWLPNMWLLQHHSTTTDSEPLRRPRFGYLLKEIFGLYSLHDRYIFVTDGGHWDNLGLVELLRRRCDTIFCIDASGDPVGSFATLRESIGLATLELDEFQDNRVDLDKQLHDLLPRHRALPSTNVTTLMLHRKQTDGSRRDVAIYYAKLQATQDMSAELRRYAIADPKFPRYSTAQQFLSPQQFANLVQSGSEAGEKLLTAAQQVNTPQLSGQTRASRSAITAQ